jgi:hypothetical protein
LIFDEPDTPQELGVFDVRDQRIPLQFFRKRGELVQHDASDPLAAQLFSNDEIDDANGIGFDIHHEHRHELADEFADESGRRLAWSAVTCGKRADGVVIGGFDRADEELLAFHDDVNGRLQRGAFRTTNALLSCFYSISRSGK